MARYVLRGRDDESAAVAKVLRSAAEAGRGCVVCLRGEPGIGKSALLRSVTAQAAADGYAVGSGKAEELHRIAAGAPLLIALRSGPLPLLDAEAFAGLAPLHHQPLWLIDRIASLLEELARRTPVLIAIDDVQWADPVTRFALDTLPTRLSSCPIVWLVATRDLTPSRWVPSTTCSATGCC
ncbi:hypothetical protein B1R94_10335 [Mycolicibacterium litorale]|nr:hypothetical protein B1R94_10335 [Mycolicibacterium litorale]